MRRTLRRTSRFWLPLLLIPALAGGLAAQVEDLQSRDPKTRKKAAKKIGDKTGGDDRLLCDELGKVVRDPVPDVRAEVVTAMIKLKSQYCLEPLMTATRDASAEIQSMAVDGLVNFYVPGYVKFGFFNSLKSFGGSLKDRFRDPDPVIVQNFVEVRPEVIDSIARLITGGSSLESRANAARAVGILRGKSATEELLKGLESKNATIMIESLQALKKIGDPAVGPQITPYLRDLDTDVQIAAAETVGHLRVKGAVEDLVPLVQSDDKDLRRAALVALAKIPDNGQDRLFMRYLGDKDEQMRAAAAEGLGRVGNEQDLRTVMDAFAEEKKETARLSMAFAAVHLGNMNPLMYLVDHLDSRFHSGEARAFLIELARDPKVLSELYTPLTTGTDDQKIELARVIARSGNRESVPHLERLTHDDNTDVAAAAVTELRNLQARL